MKKYRNDCVVVFGGPSVSENKDVSKEIFKELPYVDYLVANEGEQPFYNIVKEFIKNRQKLISGKSEINGCFGRSNDSDIISGEALYRFEGDINEIPSPYLSGRLDKFLVDPSYLPIVQTARGCPYGCTFCVSGRRSWNKMRLFSIDRVQNEFNYILKKTASTYLRLAD